MLVKIEKIHESEVQFVVFHTADFINEYKTYEFESDKAYFAIELGFSEKDDLNCRSVFRVRRILLPDSSIGYVWSGRVKAVT